MRFNDGVVAWDQFGHFLAIRGFYGLFYELLVASWEAISLTDTLAFGLLKQCNMKQNHSNKAKYQRMKMRKIT